MANLKSSYSIHKSEAGCDEAGRGCLAGPVFAAAVILPEGYKNDRLNDSKKLTANQRMLLKEQIQKDAVAFAVAKIDAPEIDQINILNASFKAMHKAIDNLSAKPELLLIDGNRFQEYPGIPHVCFIKGDGRFLSIAAASILAKTYRDDFMEKLHHEFPEYNWIKNKGYPTMAHKLALQEHGLTPYHRKSFNYNLQLKIKF